MGICTRLVDCILSNLTEDLLQPRFRGHSNPIFGHCYVASEALYHLTGRTLRPHYLKVNGETHWVLKDNEEIIDITKEQFNHDLDYSTAKSCGFLTKEPSKRARVLIERVKGEMECYTQ